MAPLRAEKKRSRRSRRRVRRTAKRPRWHIHFTPTSASWLNQGSASLDTHAVMVAADRELRLAGYEVFRFGANEVVGGQAAGPIGSFFMRLFDLHGLR
jgi:hypothetical protein